MKPNGKTTWGCQTCSAPTKVLHECFFGKFKQLSIKYNIQIPLCGNCHPYRPHLEPGKQKIYKRIYCAELGISYAITKQALEQGNYIYLEAIRERCAKKLKQMEY